MDVFTLCVWVLGVPKSCSRIEQHCGLETDQSRLEAQDKSEQRHQQASYLVVHRLE